MYITDTTDNVRKLFEKLEKRDDISKLKFLIYIFNLLNNNQINNKNEENPDLKNHDDFIIFNLECIGFQANVCTVFLQYIIMIYNNIINANELYEENGNVFGLKYKVEEKELITKFERLSYNEKLDVFSEIIIRYENETYFKEKLTMLTFDSKLNGFDIAREIKKHRI